MPITEDRYQHREPFTTIATAEGKDGRQNGDKEMKRIRETCRMIDTGLSRVEKVG